MDSIKIICLYIKGKNTLFPMRVISQNIANYGIDVPKDAVFRVNLAWCSSINELKNILEKYPNNDIFLDLALIFNDSSAVSFVFCCYVFS